MFARLSSPVEDLKDHYEVVVVGSGYGGAIAASRLARAGRQVCACEQLSRPVDQDLLGCGVGGLTVGSFD